MRQISTDTNTIYILPSLPTDSKTATVKMATLKRQGKLCSNFKPFFFFITIRIFIEKSKKKECSIFSTKKKSLLKKNLFAQHILTPPTTAPIRIPQIAENN